MVRVRVKISIRDRFVVRIGIKFRILVRILKTFP